MQLIRFLPRSVAAVYQPKPNSVLISIYDRSEQPLKPKEGWVDVRYERFHDTDGSLMGLEVFSVEQAKEVLAFVERHESCQEVVVHCEMGHSRSAAVAIYLSEKYRVPCLKENFQVNWQTWAIYNKLVYRQMQVADSSVYY